MADIEKMIAESPAENNPTQTLFRFVSLRSPQLSHEKDQDKRFILAPQALKEDHAFYLPVVNGTGSKQRLLQTYAANYVNNPEYISSEPASQKNLKYFQRSYPLMYEFSTWLARNKNTCSPTEVLSKKNKIFDNQLHVIPEPVDLWNNLIYQTVTQKDFYIKETVIQMLFGLHLFYLANEEDIQVSLGARVVLPKELMLDDIILSSSRSASKVEGEKDEESLPTEEMKKQQLISVAKMKLEKYEALKKNLSGLEKQYQIEYQREYKAQDESYQEKIKPSLEEYYRELARAKEEFCSIKKPDVKYDPIDPCQQPREVPYPDVPKFAFSFRPEISSDILIRNLKAENMDALFDILGYEFKPESSSKERATLIDTKELEHLLEGANTFSEINSLVTEASDRSNRIIAENTEGSNEAYASIGGVMIPLARTISIPFTYQICLKAVYKLFNLDLSLNVPDSSWDVSGVSYALLGNGSHVTNSYFVKSRTGNTIFLNDMLDQGLEFSIIQDSSFDIKVYFTNGRIAQFRTSGINVRTCVSSKFELVVEEGEPPIIIDNENHFIPSGFGFKQIGIADYLKVEQSTHAYVEGEVAHIENVMAREYREKSTRRLRRSENTTTTSSDTEREQLSDTTTANRFEMQSEISKMMQESNDASGFASANFKGTNFSMSAGANYANHRSKEESTRQAVTQAQDITARAMDRIVTKVHEERIEKIIDEFEENNSHGLDNRKGDKHVVGVYRWVDKLMKNQIYNYGKRLMFEFMIPEPAKLHLLWLGQNKATTTLVKPEDPRTSATMQMKDYAALGSTSGDAVFKYWTGKFNLDFEKKLEQIIYISHSFSDKNLGFDDNGKGRWTGVYNNNDFEIPENYEALGIKGSVNFGNGNQFGGSVSPGSSAYICGIKLDSSSVNIVFNTNESIRNKITISTVTWDIKGISGSLVAKCQLTKEANEQWQQKTFKAIIDAYEDALVEYNNKVAEEKTKAVEIKGSNPNFYRQIENTVLRKNCISYIVDRNVGSTQGYGLEGLTQGSSFGDYETVLSSNLDKYTAFIKFMEQAFEWENLSYYLYPYYWGKKTNWNELYQSDDTDPLFKSFLQSGMARVVATVRPGFEDAVQFYMATGKIWNGAEVPIIGDELYLSIVDEMKEPKGIKQGKAWLTRLPTALNILQAESIGLKVAHALPFSTENPDDFEVPSEVITEDKFNFEKNDNLLGVRESGTSSEKVISGDWK